MITSVPHHGPGIFQFWCLFLLLPPHASCESSCYFPGHTGIGFTYGIITDVITDPPRKVLRPHCALSFNQLDLESEPDLLQEHWKPSGQRAQWLPCKEESSCHLAVAHKQLISGGLVLHAFPNSHTEQVCHTSCLVKIHEWRTLHYLNSLQYYQIVNV